MNEKKCYKIAMLKGLQGQGLIATKAIKTGAIMFEEEAVASFLNINVKRICTLVDYPCTYEIKEGEQHMSIFVALTLRICKDKKLVNKIKSLALYEHTTFTTKERGHKLLTTDIQKYIYRIIRTNCYQQCDMFLCKRGGKTGIGTGLFPIASRINHRCCKFNCDVNVNGSRARVIAIRDIKIGEQITTAYIENQLGKLEIQRKAIKKNCGFDCICHDCSNSKFRNPISISTDIITLLLEIDTLLNQKQEYTKNYTNAVKAVVDVFKSSQLDMLSKLCLAKFLFFIFYSHIDRPLCGIDCVMVAMEVIKWKTENLLLSINSNSIHRFILFCMVYLCSGPPGHPQYNNEMIYTHMKKSPHLSFYSIDLLYTHATLFSFGCRWMNNNFSDINKIKIKN